MDVAEIAQELFELLLMARLTFNTVYKSFATHHRLTDLGIC